MFTLVPIFSRTQLGQLEFLAARRFIRNEMLCDTCGARCGLTRRQESHDGFRWRCRPCHYVKSIHTNNVENMWMRAKRQLNATSARLASCFQPTSASSCGGKEFERNETPSAPCSAAFISTTAVPCLIGSDEKIHINSYCVFDLDLQISWVDTLSISRTQKDKKYTEHWESVK